MTTPMKAASVRVRPRLPKFEAGGRSMAADKKYPLRNQTSGLCFWLTAYAAVKVTTGRRTVAARRRTDAGRDMAVLLIRPAAVSDTLRSPTRPNVTVPTARVLRRRRDMPKEVEQLRDRPTVPSARCVWGLSSELEVLCSGSVSSAFLRSTMDETRNTRWFMSQSTHVVCMCTVLNQIGTVTVDVQRNTYTRR